jgi:hypothetical protein
MNIVQQYTKEIENWKETVTVMSLPSRCSIWHASHLGLHASENDNNRSTKNNASHSIR